MKRPRPKAIRRAVVEKPLSGPDAEAIATRQRYFEICILVVLLAFGIYKSVALYRAVPVPNPDYASFVRTGKAIIGGRLPGSFKRAPVLPTLQVGLSRFIGGAHPILTASCMLNAIFASLNVVLAWLVGKKFLATGAIWFALVAMLSPWILRYEVDPIAETSMILITLTTFYFIFRQSNWAYVFAAIAPMVRYELLALILVVFIVDMTRRKTKKERWFVLLFAFLASVPFLLWMLGTALTWETSSHSHYIHNYANFVQNRGRSVSRSGFGRFFFLLWDAAFAPLFQLPAQVKAAFAGAAFPQAATLNLVSKIIASLSIISAIVYAVCKRCWNLLAMIIFLGLYITVHSLRINSHTRYCVPAIWVVLLVAWVGLQSSWKLINLKDWIPKSVVLLMQFVIIAIASVWLVKCLLYLPRTAPYCKSAATLPYVAMGTIALVLILSCGFFRRKFLMRDLTISVLAAVMIVSQHFTTTRVIANGSYNIEFKYLMDWYSANAAPGEKIACTWATLLRLLGDKHAKNIVGIAPYKGQTMAEFVENCRRENIVYVAWTHRGSGRKHRKGMSHIQEVLVRQRDNGYMKFVERIELPSRKRNRWINIFKLRPPPVPPKTEFENQKKNE